MNEQNKDSFSEQIYRRISKSGQRGLEQIAVRGKAESSGLEESEAKALNKPFVFGLLFGSVLLLGALLFLVWALPHFGSRLFTPEAGQGLLFCVIGLFSLVLIFCIVLTAALALNKRLPFMHRIRGTMNLILFPLMRLLGILLRIPKSKVRLAFIRLNNDLVKVSQIRCNPDELLILLPHCIQKSACSHRLTHNIQACARCGGCAVGSLLELAECYGVEAVIVPGGTIARQMVKEKHPKCLIAVACHRDLTSGVRDVAALPVFGVTNQRPFGPCINTTVDVEEIEKAIQIFLGK